MEPRQAGIEDEDGHGFGALQRVEEGTGVGDWLDGMAPAAKQRQQIGLQIGVCDGEQDGRRVRYAQNGA